LNYSFHPDAEKELNEAIAYYNECQNGLGLEFTLEKERKGGLTNQSSGCGKTAPLI